MADPEPNLVRLPNVVLTPQLDLWLLPNPDLKKEPRVRVLMAYVHGAIRYKKVLATGEYT